MPLDKFPKGCLASTTNCIEQIWNKIQVDKLKMPYYITPTYTLCFFLSK